MKKKGKYFYEQKIVNKFTKKKNKLNAML